MHKQYLLFYRERDFYSESDLVPNDLGVAAVRAAAISDFTRHRIRFREIFS